MTPLTYALAGFVVGFGVATLIVVGVAARPGWGWPR